MRVPRLVQALRRPTTSPARADGVQGRCPACHRGALILGDGGYVTCSHLDCPQPDAASTLLEQRAPAPGTVECDNCHDELGHDELNHLCAPCGALAAVAENIIGDANQHARSVKVGSDRTWDESADGPSVMPLTWVDGDPLMNALALAVYEHCNTEECGSLVVDDPRNIAAAAAHAALAFHNRKLATADEAYAARLTEWAKATKRAEQAEQRAVRAESGIARIRRLLALHDTGPDEGRVPAGALFDAIHGIKVFASHAPAELHGHDVLAHVTGADGLHRYVSTYCVHDRCGDCRLTCKTCGAPCLHGCHNAGVDDTSPTPAPVVHPTDTPPEPTHA